MTGVLVALCAVLGLAVGSFLNVVVHRVPAGASVVSPPSACPDCGHRVRLRDNVPVVSWLALRGRCRDCGVGISVRYPIVEVCTAGVFVSTAVAFGPTTDLPAFLYLAAVAVALTAIDLEHHRLPDAIVLPSYAVGGALLATSALVQGDPGALLRAAIASAALWATYLALVLAYPAGMGFGDVKLAGVLGLYLGYLGWGQLVVGAMAAFVVGGLVGVALVAVGRAGRRTAIPFGPFMLLGAALGVVVGDDLAGWYLGVAGL